MLDEATLFDAGLQDVGARESSELAQTQIEVRITCLDLESAMRALA